MSSQLTLNDSTVNGDVVQGDKVYNPIPLSGLEKTIDAIVSKYGQEAELLDICEELAEYLTDHPERKVIGLKAKLVNGNREDLYDRARHLKNKFDRKIAKKQLSKVTQGVYIHLLSNIISLFEQKIRPLINSDVSQAEVDEAIFDKLIEPIYQGIVRFNDMATTEDVSGMLYYLTGKCHIVWGKLC